METPRPPRVRAFSTTLSVALIAATVFVVLSPGRLAATNLAERFTLILTAQSPTVAAPEAATATPVRIGVVAGHSGNINDSGAVCRDASGAVYLTEVQVNEAIAWLVVEELTRQGYQVDLLHEFDVRLNGYRAAALVSIHNDSCDPLGDQATGFKIAAAMNTRDTNRATRLIECLRDRYAAATGLTFRAGSVTADMTSYHAFDEIDPSTTAAIIETGFLNLDYDLLVNRTQAVADGVTGGILCFVRNESLLGP